MTQLSLDTMQSMTKFSMPLRRAPRLDPSAIRSSFAQAPTAEGLNHVYENGAGVGRPGPVPVARDGWLGALIVATDSDPGGFLRNR
jgi:hypothetical protein